ncbi:MAG: gliding motility-associated C-terminal domain-containing protein [Saprospiraceae bacterium]|nr:gliding motility-associated C-terminal domain-containing protein [Saprospiraceae bacterium]
MSGDEQWRYLHAANPIFTVYAGQEFIVTMYIFTSNGCDGSKTEELKLEFIEEYLPDTTVLCQGDSLAINPLGSTEYSYFWTPNIAISDQHAANPTVWPTQTTVYTVEITSLVPDTCSITREITVFVPTKIDVTAPVDTLTCGETVTLCATTNLPQAQFEWAIIPDGFIGNGSCLSVLPSNDTNYEIIATDQYGCQDRDTVFVADEQVRINWQGLGGECPETEQQLTVNNLVADHVLTYAWTVTGSGQVLPPATGPSATIVTPVAGQISNYTVVATNQFGCTGTVTQFINSYDFVPTVVESDTTCPNVTQSLNPGANPNLNYVWSPSLPLSCSTCPNPDVTVSQPTDFTVVVSAMFGANVCSDTIEVSLFAPPLIEINGTVDTFTCGEPIVIAAQTNITNPSIQWKDSSGGLVGLNVNQITVDPADMETYTICVTDAFQCTALEAIVVENRQLDLELTGAGVIDTCPMPSYNICIINLDPEDLLDYDWTASNGGTILSGDGTPCPEVTSEQGETSLFEVVVTNQWGCSSTEQFDITTYAFDPTIRATLDICPEVPTPINPEAEGSSLDYYWTPSIGLSCTNCPNPLATLNATQFYQVTILGYNGLDTCSFTQTVQVRVAPKINLEALPTDTVLCDSSDLLLTATYTSPFVTDIAWSQTLNFSNPFATTPTVTVMASGTELYYVQLTDTLGCHDTALVTVYAYPVDISIGDTLSYCEEIGSLFVPVTNHHPDQTLTFTWTPTDYIEVQNPDGSVQLVGLLMDETYTVTAVNQYGCEETETTEVFYYDIEPTLDSITSTEDTIIFGSGQFSQLGINDWPGYTYEWSPSEGLSDPSIPNPTAMPEETTTYVLTVTDQGGCTATRTVTIFVWNPDCDEPNLFLPNAFTPNDDDGNSMNDVLYFRSNIVVEMELAIYNRWGQRVFYSEDQSIGWDGKFNGQPLPPDVYGFYLRAKCYNGQEYFKKGNITLLR